MNHPLMIIAVLTALLPLFAALIAGLCGKQLGPVHTHRFVISLIALAFFLSCYLFKKIVMEDQAAIEEHFYTWASAGMLRFDVAFLLDRLSAAMIMVVLFVSLAVHIYTIGYMAGDPGYSRFFSYVSLFTFAMLILVLANNFLLLFFGWEGVGLVSYLLIGFWFKRESANVGSLKAFLVNRIADIGFIIAMAAVLKYFGSLDYHEVFHLVPSMNTQTLALFPHYAVPVLSLICLLFFIGAMGKSAQVPLHVWLPESMEGPTPISALIHAATMVTAGIYMVARLSPLFEYSPAVLSCILIIGGSTAFFMGLVAIVQNDIKRVIAYSTLSQLGYMVVALGASAYDAAIFHLITHAFFKALLFLAAGSVILALHHEQDMRHMGGLAARLPITYLTFVIGTLALSAIPPFSGFYSKDVIIEAVKLSSLPGAVYAYYCVLAGAFVTPLYMFRALFMTFHTPHHKAISQHAKVHESPWVVLLPLIALAIPSIIVGYLLIDPLLFAQSKFLGDAIFVLPNHNVLAQLASDYQGAAMMALKAGSNLPLWLAIGGIVTAWIFILRFPQCSVLIKQRCAWIYRILVNKYGFDAVNQLIFVRGTKEAGHIFYEVSDVKIIDGVCVNGSGRLIRFFAQMTRWLQTGYLYHYALSIVLGLVLLLVWALGGFN